MTQEKKLLLLKDLCARLPYGVKMSNINAIHNGLNLPPITVEITDYENSNPLLLIDSGFRPYLRPMSSMTEEERNDFYHNRTFHDGRMWESEGSDVDWLNEHHFDYRGLIEKGLALEATEDLYED